jgi:hypothetical protein
LSTFLALVCIILAFVVGIIDEKVMFNSLTWLVAAIAFALLRLPGLPFVTGRRG